MLGHIHSYLRHMRPICREWGTPDILKKACLLDPGDFLIIQAGPPQPSEKWLTNWEESEAHTRTHS